LCISNLMTTSVLIPKSQQLVCGGATDPNAEWHTKRFPTAWVKCAAQRMHGLPQDQQKQQFTSATLFARVQRTSCICTGPAVSTCIPSIQAYTKDLFCV